MFKEYKEYILSYETNILFRTSPAILAAEINVFVSHHHPILVIGSYLSSDFWPDKKQQEKVSYQNNGLERIGNRVLLLVHYEKNVFTCLEKVGENRQSYGTNITRPSDSFTLFDHDSSYQTPLIIYCTYKYLIYGVLTKPLTRY